MGAQLNIKDAATVELAQRPARNCARASPRPSVRQLAYREFGIGSGHPARLNFGDRFAYALARTTGEPLLFKGDFVHADVMPAL